MATYFKVRAFSPDGRFTCEELKEYLYTGMNQVNREQRQMFRMAPFEVEEIPDSEVYGQENKK